MRKSYIICCMIALAAVMACNKLETNGQLESKEEENGYGVIYATTEATKTILAGSGISEHIEWVKGDEVKVYPNASNTIGADRTYVAQNSGSSVEFTGEALTKYVAAVYPASVAGNKCANTVNEPQISATVHSEQDGKFHNLVFAGVPKVSGSKEFLFSAITSVIKINIPAEKNVVELVVASDQNICGDFSAKYSNTDKNWTTTNSTSNLGKKITVKAKSGETISGPVYIAVLPCTKLSNITVSLASTEKYNSKTNQVSLLRVNTIEDFGTANINLNIFNKGFTIDESGKQVFMAPGNLQYQASSRTWRFAEHQYDFVGPNSENNDVGTVYVDGKKCSNEQSSSEYSGWIDQFGFGATGCNKNVMPYETNGDNFPDVDILEESNWAYDWGRFCNISNDPYGDKKWHTMTRDQWKYVYERKNSDGTKKFCRVLMTVAVSGKNRTVRGNFIFPDFFVIPENVEFTYGSYENNFTLENFEKMVVNGAVFLPYCSFLGGNIYYSTTGRYQTNKKGLSFDCSADGYSTKGAYSGHQRCSVRLVRDVPNM